MTVSFLSHSITIMCLDIPLGQSHVDLSLQPSDIRRGVIDLDDTMDRLVSFIIRTDSLVGGGLGF